MRKPDKDIDKALEYLCKHTKGPMTFEEMAHRCGCSAQNIENIFHSAIKKIKIDKDVKDILDELR